MSDDSDMTIWEFLQSDHTFLTPSGRTAIERADGTLERIGVLISHPGTPEDHFKIFGMDAWEYDGIYFISYWTGTNIWKAAESKEEVEEYIEEAQDSLESLKSTAGA